MAIPNVTITVNPNGIPVVPAGAGNTPLLLGTSSAGAFGALSAFADIQALTNSNDASAPLAGPLADKAALDLVSGAPAVQCWRMFSGSVYASALAASSTILQPNLQGLLPGVGTVSFEGVAGSLTPAIKVLVSSDTTGPVIATFDYSLDGGATFAGAGLDLTVAGTPLGSSGITVIASVSPAVTGNYVAGDGYLAGGVQIGVTAGTGTVTVSGDPVAPYGNEIGDTGNYTGVIVQITISSTSSVTAQFNYSLDGGSSFSGSLTVPASLQYVIPNTGLTLTFSASLGAGVFVSGDTYRATIEGFQGQMYGYSSSPTNGFALQQVGAVGTVASARGAGTFSPGATSALGLKYLSASHSYGNFGSGSVFIFGDIGVQVPVLKIVTSSDGSTTNGTFDYSLSGGLPYTSYTGTQGIPDPGVAVQLGTSGIFVICAGPQTGGFYNSGVFDQGDLYGEQLASPIDEYSVQIQITASGGIGNAQYIFSMDGGITFSPVQTLSAANFVLGNTGVSLTADAAGGEGPTAGFQAGDVYSFSTLPPQFTTADVSNVLGILTNNPAQFGWVHVIGKSNEVSTAPSRGFDMVDMDTTLQSSLLNWWANDVFSNLAFMESPTDTTQSSIDSELELAVSSMIPGTSPVQPCISVGAGDEAVVSPLTGYQLSRNCAWSMSARCCSAPAGQDLADVAAGAVVGVTNIYRNEAQTPGLDAVGYSTMRTFNGFPGYFITNGNIIAPNGSDLFLVQYARVINTAAYLAYQALLQYLNTSVRVTGAGTIDPRDAVAIDNTVQSRIQQGLAGQITAVSVQVSLTHNILADGIMPVLIVITPLGYAKEIQVTLGFTNSALSALSA